MGLEVVYRYILVTLLNKENKSKSFEDSKRIQQPSERGREASSRNRDEPANQALETSTSTAVSNASELLSARSKRATVVTSVVDGSGLSLRDHVALDN
ncbi:unnamed protein product [Trichogramma brassicae]|uniref:Uncharacterized protein n=1 Tax=Trichogramma brassicae TaxID=86971 RepID=A0A6H5I2Z5_9HYME|nr:unnamed protein product [Trichogramma brassicae]